MRKMMDIFSPRSGEDEDEEFTETSEEYYADDDYSEEEDATVTQLHPTQLDEADLRRIVTVRPTTYNEARQVGEAFRDGTPVIMNLEGMPEAEAKRMVDFAAGLVFGLAGVMEKVTNRVFLLSPATVEVANSADLS